MDNFTILESVSNLVLESERISSQQAFFDKIRKERTQSQDLEISPWFGANDILRSIEPWDVQKEIAEKQSEGFKTDIEASCRVIYSSRRNKHDKIISPVFSLSKKVKIIPSQRVIFHRQLDEKYLNNEEVSQGYPSMLLTPDSMSTEHSSSPKISKFGLEIKRRSRMSLTQKVFETPRVKSFTDLNFYPQVLPSLNTVQSKNIENSSKTISLPKKLHNLNSELPSSQFPQTPSKSPHSHILLSKNYKTLSKQNIILNIQDPKNSYKSLPTVKTKFLKP